MDEDGDATPTPPPGRTWLRPLALGLATLLVAAGGGLAWVAQQAGTERFCYAAQGFRVIDGETVLTQAGGPDPEACGGPDRIPGELVLGRDCKVRQDDGTVTTELPPETPDGRCH